MITVKMWKRLNSVLASKSVNSASSQRGKGHTGDRWYVNASVRRAWEKVIRQLERELKRTRDPDHRKFVEERIAQHRRHLSETDP